MWFFPCRVWISVQQLWLLLLCNVLGTLLQPPPTVQSTRMLWSDEEEFGIHGRWSLTWLEMALCLPMYWGQRTALLRIVISGKLKVLLKIH